MILDEIIERTKALEKDSSNIAYIDTLAWGEYKLKNCKEAFINMKKVVDEVGLDDAEIKLHWENIKECYRKNKRKSRR